MQFALARAALVRHRTRTVLAIAGVAVAAAMLLDMVMMSTGMRESFRELLLSRGFQIRLAPRGTLPFDTDATIPGVSSVMRLLRQNPQIEVVSPVLGASLHVPRGEDAVASAALGVIPPVQGDYELLSGRDPSRENHIAVNDDFLRATGAKVGDTLTVTTGYDPQLRTYTASRTVLITGRVRFLYGSVNQPGAAMMLPVLQQMAAPKGTDAASLFMIRISRGADEESVRAWLERNIPTASAISIASALEQVDDRLAYFRQLALILGTVSLFVGFLLVTTLMTVSVNDRLGEIAVLRAIGVSRAHVVQQIVLEGMAITITGAVLGLLLGLVTARYLNSILSTFPGLPVAIDFFLFQPRAAWTALSMLTISGIAAGIYPSWRAASLPVATTLRENAIA